MQIPVISAIGHETDYTICDFVADARAATPSVAAQIVILDKKEVTERIKKIISILKNNAESKLALSRKEFESLTSRRILKKPGSLIMERWQELDGLKKSMVSAVTGNLARKKSALQSKPAAINIRQVRGRLRLEDSHLKSLLFSLVSGFNKYIAALKNSTVLLIKDLQANSPITVLEKGYAFYLKRHKRSEKALKT